MEVGAAADHAVTEPDLAVLDTAPIVLAWVVLPRGVVVVHEAAPFEVVAPPLCAVDRPQWGLVMIVAAAGWQGGAHQLTKRYP